MEIKIKTQITLTSEENDIIQKALDLLLHYELHAPQSDLELLQKAYEDYCDDYSAAEQLYKSALETTTDLLDALLSTSDKDD